MNYYQEHLKEVSEGWIESVYQRDPLIKNNRAIYGDEVYIFENEVVGIKKRNKEKIVGILYMDSTTKYGSNSKGHPLYLCKPVNTKYEPFYVASSKKELVKWYVNIEFGSWEMTQRLPIGNVVDYIGKVGDEHTEYEMLREYHHLFFSNWKLKKEKEKEKEEKIEYEVFSIDPEGAIDIDDAFHYRKIDDDKYEIGVHIASPTKHFDKIEDFRKVIEERITTVYLPHKKYNLLPDIYADDLSSLLEGKIRDGLSIIYQYNGKNQCVCFEVKETKIRNRKNYHYEEVDVMIGKKFKKGGDQEMKEMYEKTKKIFGMETLDSHKYVELWMIETNKKIAEYCIQKYGGKTILRVCPNEEIPNISDLEEYLRRKELKSANYEYYDEGREMSHRMLKANYYTHFTSPIRRSIDFYTHLLVRGINLEGIDLKRINECMRNTRRLQRDLNRMQFIFGLKEEQVEREGYIVEIQKRFMKIYIPENKLEERLMIEDSKGYYLTKKIEYIENTDHQKIEKVKIDDMEFSLYSKIRVKLWIFRKEHNIHQKIRLEYC